MYIDIHIQAPDVGRLLRLSPFIAKVNCIYFKIITNIAKN